MNRLSQYGVLAFALGALSCGKEDDAPVDPGPGGGTSAFELHLELDGADVHHLEGSSSHLFVPGAQGDCNLGLTVCTSYQESVVTDSIDVNDRWQVGLIRTFHGLPGSTPPVDSVNLMVIPGDRPFGKFLFNAGTLSYDIVDGVRLVWTDLAGVDWSTDRGSADQSTSSFTITEAQSTGDPFGPRFKFRCTFHCTLYNDVGGSKTVSNGFLFGPVITS